MYILVPMLHGHPTLGSDMHHKPKDHISRAETMACLSECTTHFNEDLQHGQPDGAAQ